MLRRFLLLSAALCCAFLISPARAEIGIPGAPGGFYFSIEGGYQQSNAPGVAAQGASTVVPGTPTGNGSSSSVASGSNPDTGAATFNLSSSTGSSVATLSAASGPVVLPSIATATLPTLNAAGVLGIGAPADGTTSVSVGTPSATASPDGGGFIRANQGGYSVFTLGYVLPEPVGILSRIEVYGGGNFADNSESVSGAFGLRGVDNNSAIAFGAVPANTITGSIEQHVDEWEVGLRLKADEHFGPLPVAFSAEPFYINYLQDTTSSAAIPFSLTNIGSISGSRLSNVGASLYGVQLAAEAVAPLFGNLSLIGRGSAGLYGINADADFSSLFGINVGNIATVAAQGAAHDDQNRMGYRLGAQGGIRYAFSPSVWLSLIGTVDYLSEIPTAVLPREVGDPAAHIAFTGLLDWGVGMRLTLASF